MCNFAAFVLSWQLTPEGTRNKNGPRGRRENMRYRSRYQVLNQDVDANGNIRPSGLLTYMQETANRQMRDRKPTYEELFSQNIAFIIARMSLEIKAEIREFDEIDVETWKAGTKFATFLRGYEVSRKGEVMATAFAEWTTVDVVSRNVLPAESVDLSNYETDEPPVLDIPKRYRFPRGIETEQAGTYDVMYKDVDRNAHMNNTRYADVMWSLIPGVENKIVTSVNIRYREEGRIGSRLNIYRAPVDKEILHDPRAGEGWAFRSETGGSVNAEIMFGMRDEGLAPVAFSSQERGKTEQE